jgi:hypothetical protein
VLAEALFGAGFTVPQVFLFTGIANAVVAFYILVLVPEYLLRLIALLAKNTAQAGDAPPHVQPPVDGLHKGRNIGGVPLCSSRSVLSLKCVLNLVLNVVLTQSAFRSLMVLRSRNGGRSQGSSSASAAPR